MRTVESNREQRVSDFQNTYGSSSADAGGWSSCPESRVNNIARGLTMTRMCAFGIFHRYYISNPTPCRRTPN